MVTLHYKLNRKVITSFDVNVPFYLHMKSRGNKKILYKSYESLLLSTTVMFLCNDYWNKFVQKIHCMLMLWIYINETKMKFLSLAALEVVIMTTSSAASDKNFIKTTTFLFQLSISHNSIQIILNIDVFRNDKCVRNYVHVLLKIHFLINPAPYFNRWTLVSPSTGTQEPSLHKGVALTGGCLC